MTYSIAARCARTGRMGVAVASHAFGVGQVVPWGRAGVGVGATQSIPRALYSTELPRLLAEGAEPAAALDRAMAADDRPQIRQIGVVDARGRAAGHTGDLCVSYAGGLATDDVAVQGNMLAADGVWHAMADRFAQTSGDLADRLMAALRAADERGGDVRGRQAAALLIVEATSRAGSGVLLDVRVDDHPEPLREMDRLIALHHADHLMRTIIDRALAGDPEIDGPVHDLRASQETFGDGNLEPTFWECVIRARAGRPDHALLKTIAQDDEAWTTLYRRLTDLGLVPDQGAS